MTDLAQHIRETRLIDTHEHLAKEAEYVEKGPDVLQDLFSNYVTADLVVAGATPQSVQRLCDASDADVRGRLNGVWDAWQKCSHTGYGEAVRLIARDAYGMDEITPDAVVEAAPLNEPMNQPGERLRILRDVANLDHVQIDDFCRRCVPHTSGPDFFLYDLSWAQFCRGELPEPEELHDEVGVDVVDLPSLRAAMGAVFEKYGPCAIAVKAQHAYNRTLLWRERSDGEVEPILQKNLRQEALTEEERLCLGDWCWARGVELAIEHNLPFKIHTGYYAGYGNMPVERIRAGHLCALLAKYPAARFVLMHTAYPYSDELVALAKHYPNAYVDLCWAWSIDPFSTSDFVRRMIHAVPAHKLFAFGGDTFWPHAVAAYALQAREWLTRTLQSDIDQGLLSEPAAMRLATRMMQENQRECFDIAGTRAAIAREAIECAT